MRKAIVILVLLFIPIILVAANTSTANQGQIASGADKEAHAIAHPHENHGEGDHPPKTYFGIPGWLLKLANMALFIGVLGYFVGGPVKKAFAERSEAIRNAAAEARARREKADQLASDIQARLTQIELDVKSIHERAVAEGERQKRELIAAAEVEAQKILQSATNEIDNRLKHARHELTEYAGQLAAQRAEAILRERITPADQEKLFKESLQQVEGARS
ncbi:MAG: hypothetical protein ABI837_04360 [Acidobacteriota bacterium]